MNWNLKQHLRTKVLEVHFDKSDDFIYCQPGSFVSSTGEIKMDVILGDEKEGLFDKMLNALKSQSGVEFVKIKISPLQVPAEVHIAGAGEIFSYDLKNGSLFVSDRAYLAHIGNIKYRLIFGGLKSWASGSGFFIAQYYGTGIIFLESRGSIVKKELEKGEYMYLDEDHFVATNRPYYEIEFIQPYSGNFVSKIIKGSLSAEGRVMKIPGPAEVYYYV